MVKYLNMNRYIRQMVLPEVGESGQKSLQQATILIVGAGALSVPVLQYLTGAGIGNIILLDQDRIEEGNLHRQTLYRMSDIGQYKVEVAAREMQALNPDVSILAVIEWLSTKNAHSWVKKVDVVLDCADSYAVSYILSDVCLNLKKPLISASVLGLEGYVGGFCGGAPSLRAIFSSPSDNGATCATAGVLGPVVGILGSIQAQMTLRILLNLKPSPLGQFIRLDANGRFSQFKFDKAEENPGPYFISLNDISIDDLVIDVRGTEEAPILPVKHAIRCLNNDIESILPIKQQRIVIICRSGLRAWRVANQLTKKWKGEIALLAMQTEETL